MLSNYLYKNLFTNSLDKVVTTMVIIVVTILVLLSRTCQCWKFLATQQTNDDLTAVIVIVSGSYGRVDSKRPHVSWGS